jgi:hypothetical protein
VQYESYIEENDRYIDGGSASLGILLCLFFLIQTWRIRQPATEKLQTAFSSASSILQTTGSGLDIIDQIVTNVYSSTTYLSEATDALANTIENTDKFVNSAGSFLGEGFNTTITNTQKTLESAQSSALVIDNILTTLSKIPLIGINYNPTIPLSTALGDVSSSLDPLQESLTGFQDSLQSTQSNLSIIKDKMVLLNQNIIIINENLADSQAVIEKYKTQVTTLQNWVDQAVISMPTWVTTACVIISFFIILLILVQSTIVLQGVYLYSNRNDQTASASETNQNDAVTETTQ